MRLRIAGSGRVRDLLEREAFIVAILALVVAIPLATMSLWVVQDTWLALVDGRLIAHHWLPQTDTLTQWTLGRPWIDQQWAAHLTLYELEATLGLKAVVGFAIALSAIALGVLAVGARRLGASPRSAAFGMLIPVLASPWLLQVRSQTLALVPFAAVYVLLDLDARRPSRRVLFVIPVLALWANLHGSVALGVALVALYALSLLRRPAHRLRGLLLAVSAPLCLVASPYGFALIGYYRLMLFHPPLASFVKEWQPASLSPTTALFFLSAFAMTALCARHRHALTLFERWALPLLLLAALLAVRNAVWFELATVVAFPRLLEASWPHRVALTPQLRRLNLSIALSSAVLLLFLATVELARPEQTLHPGRTTAIANAVAQAAGPHGTVIADDANADWLLWAEPTLAGRVAYDVRFELYTKPELETLKAFDDQSPIAWQDCATGALVITFANPNSAARARNRRLLTQGSSVIARTSSFVAVRQPAKHQQGNGEDAAKLCGSRNQVETTTPAKAIGAGV